MSAYCSVPLTYAKLMPNVCNVHQRMDKISHTSAYVGAIRCGVSTPSVCRDLKHAHAIYRTFLGCKTLSLTGSASRTDLSQLANGIWEIHAGCPSFLRVSSVAKIGYIPQFKASNARDQDEVSSDLTRMVVKSIYSSKNRHW